MVFLGSRALNTWYILHWWFLLSAYLHTLDLRPKISSGVILGYLINSVKLSSDVGSWGTYIALDLPKISSVGFLSTCLVTQNIFPRLPKIASVGLSYRHFRCLSRAWEFKLLLTALKGKGHWGVWVSTQLVIVDTSMKEGVPLRLKLRSHIQVKYV